MINSLSDIVLRGDGYAPDRREKLLLVVQDVWQKY